MPIYNKHTHAFDIMLNTSIMYAPTTIQSHISRDITVGIENRILSLSFIWRLALHKYYYILCFILSVFVICHYFFCSPNLVYISTYH